MVRVRARFSAAAALRREPRCADTPGGPLRTSAVSPPVGSK
jgi:hypothetical protein